ncbi:hypothetical protein GmHk_20G057069 [Glycine max]|nr:hypothetical protein GmHk_20G057069 [Glycine max]
MLYSLTTLTPDTVSVSIYIILTLLLQQHLSQCLPSAIHGGKTQESLFQTVANLSSCSCSPLQIKIGEEKNYYYVLLLLDIIPCHLKIQPQSLNPTNSSLLNFTKPWPLDWPEASVAIVQDRIFQKAKNVSYKALGSITLSKFFYENISCTTLLSTRVPNRVHYPNDFAIQRSEIQHINCFCGIMRVAEIDVAVTKGLLGGHVLANSNGNDLGNLVEEIESITTRMIASL